MADWLFIVRPGDAAGDGGPSVKERYLGFAETSPRRNWCLSRRRRMAAGDRLWVYFASPVREVAAMAEIDGEPREAPGNPWQPWTFPATLDAGATRNLCRNPVPLHALSNRRPQGVTRVRDEDLPLLLRHAGL
ncbi:hypothetical protein GCM10010420_07190 [Streptomyces glaucosporus]|uniref:EVE domain-containing protein n=1 Tax=Streptomyces glaucosporus TaxID=284044 RepID=A0ABP5UUH5_9ACTN